MDKSRFEKLKKLLESDPGNTFARYGLALELVNSGDLNEAWKNFEYLLKNNPDYLPTYYQAGMILHQLGRKAEAIKIFTSGIELAGNQADPHTQNELQVALDELGNP